MEQMIEIGSEVMISACPDLEALRLSGLAGRRAIMTEDLTIPERRHVGYMVRLLDGKFMDEDNWYVPANAICRA